MRRSLRILAAVALGATLACQLDDHLGPDPTKGPGALQLRLTTPNGDDGALLLSISGGPIDSITSPQLEIAALEMARGEFRVLIRGPIRGGAVARLWVPDRGDRSAYVFTVVEAVGRTSYARRDVGEYTATAGLDQ